MDEDIAKGAWRPGAYDAGGALMFTPALVGGAGVPEERVFMMPPPKLKGGRGRRERESPCALLRLCFSIPSYAVANTRHTLSPPSTSKGREDRRPARFSPPPPMMHPGAMMMGGFVGGPGFGGAMMGPGMPGAFGGMGGGFGGAGMFGPGRGPMGGYGRR